MSRMRNRVYSRKIIFVANEAGAFQHHRGFLTTAMRNAGREPIIYAAPVGDLTEIKCEFRPLAIERFRFHLRRDLALFSSVLRALLRERPEVIHLINIKPYLFGGLAARVARILGWRGRTVVTVPGLGRLFSADAFRLGVPWLRRVVAKLFLRLAMRGAYVTFETNSDRDVWIASKIVTQDQTTVIKGAGINLSAFSALQRSQCGQLRVLFAGRLLRKKGLPTYLKAASVLAGQGSEPVIRMMVAGALESDPDAVSENILRNTPSVEYLGFVNNMPKLLADVDVVVLPSDYNEGIPRILIEAAAAGCVLVAGRFPGSQSLILNGLTGYFLETSDEQSRVRELVTLLYKLASDRANCHRVGMAAKAYVTVNGFANEDVCERFLSVYGIENRAVGVPKLEVREGQKT